jgi:hypothetical protein
LLIPWLALKVIVTLSLGDADRENSDCVIEMSYLASDIEYVKRKRCITLHIENHDRGGLL